MGNTPNRLSGKGIFPLEPPTNTAGGRVLGAAALSDICSREVTPPIISLKDPFFSKSFPS